MSHLTALMLARSEEWCIGATLRVALKWVDSVIVSLHACTDRTEEIVREIDAESGGRVYWEKNDDPLWHEMFHRDHQLDMARELGATHLAIIDADEMLTANLLQQTRDQILALPPHITYSLPMIPPWRSLTHHRVDDCVWSRAILSLAFADGEGIRWRPGPWGHFHRRFPDQTMTKSNPRHEDHRARRGLRRNIQPIVREPEPADPTISRLSGGVIHLQFAHWNRLVQKHVWYRLQETVLHPGLKTPEKLNETYSLALNEEGLQTAPMPPEWYAGYEDLLPLIDLRSESWHVEDCKRMLAEYGEENFAGIDRLGVC